MTVHRPTRAHGTPMRPGEHVVVIGFGPVAARFVDDVADLDAAGTIRLTVIGGETDPAYNRVLVGEHAMGRTERATMALADPELLACSGIDVLLGTQVTRIDLSATENRAHTVGDVETYVRARLAGEPPGAGPSRSEDEIRRLAARVSTASGAYASSTLPEEVACRGVGWPTQLSTVTVPPPSLWWMLTATSS